MCGIFFFKSLRSSEEITKEKIDLVYEIHQDRGPDEKNHIIQKNWMMIHTRLAITNPKSGHQPISNKSKTAFMVFNGEIYNFKDLATEFNFSETHNFSDTDLLFYLIEKIGFNKTISKLRGMFAIIYYDLNQKKYILQEIILVRNPYGFIKTKIELHFLQQ